MSPEISILALAIFLSAVVAKRSKAPLVNLILKISNSLNNNQQTINNKAYFKEKKNEMKTNKFNTNRGCWIRTNPSIITLIDVKKGR